MSEKKHREELDEARTATATAVAELAQAQREIEQVRETFARAAVEWGDEMLGVLAERDTARRELAEARDQLVQLQRELEHNAREYAELAQAYDVVQDVARTALFALDGVCEEGEAMRERVVKAIGVELPPSRAEDSIAPPPPTEPAPSGDGEAPERWVEPFEEPAQ